MKSANKDKSETGAQLGGGGEAPPSLIKGEYTSPLRRLATPVGGGGKKSTLFCNLANRES